MKDIGPKEIKELGHNIANRMLEQEKKEVGEEMNNIKGSQEKNLKLVDSLKEELENMDERLKKNIERKIERKDLNDAKIQLRRKV